jgi:hypothetical protein
MKLRKLLFEIVKHADHFGSDAESRTKMYGVIKFKNISYRSETIEGMLMLHLMYLFRPRIYSYVIEKDH